MKEEYPYSTLIEWLRKKTEANGEYREWLNKHFGGLLSKGIDVIFSKPIDDFETVDSIEVEFNQLSPSKICDCLQKIKEIFKNVSLDIFTFEMRDIGEKENVFAKIIIGENYDSIISIKDSSSSIKDKIASIKLSDNFEQIKNSQGVVEFVFTIKLTLKDHNSIDIQETITLNSCGNEIERQYWNILSESGVDYIYNLISKHELKRDGRYYYINEKLLKCDFFKAALEYDKQKKIYKNLFYDFFEMNETYSEEDTKKLEKAMDFVCYERYNSINSNWRLKGLIYWQYFNYRCADKEKEGKKELQSVYPQKKTDFTEYRLKTFPEDLLEGEDVADIFREKCLSETQIGALKKQYEHKKFTDSLLRELYSFFCSCRTLGNKDLSDKINVFIDSYKNGINRFTEQRRKYSENFKTFTEEVQKLDDNDYFSSLLKMKGERISSKYTNLYIDSERFHAKKAWKSIFKNVKCEMILIKKALQLLRAITREYGFYTACRDKWYSNYKSYKNYTQNKFPFINHERHFPKHAEVFTIIKGYYGFLKVEDSKLILVDGLTDIKTENGKPKWPELVIDCNSIDMSKSNRRLMGNRLPINPTNESIADEEKMMQADLKPLINYQERGNSQIGSELIGAVDISSVDSYNGYTHSIMSDVEEKLNQLVENNRERGGI